ncbi:oligopeptide transport system permease protein [Rubritalea squalenifaciens DSM 18772]|uniref:Oligopeptide transport system permease protein n=2 Tax=Rubritalea TaxID=361050 RepID=A0A1M6M4Y9_9BACT|nr:ABC transporter permease [Rubritalea squalenifaciens]SHJ78535.1 oligopeptide transport system permease protein [Rubritalea squalenifaciens DSM 18772]
MLKIILTRLVQGIVTLFVLLTITFVLVRLMPGSPFTEERALPPHVEKQMMERFALDKPVPVQYGKYLSNLVLKQDLGVMIKRERTVMDIISQSFPVSLSLGIASIGIAILVGIPIGVISAVKKNTWIDYGSLTLAMLGICLPSFVIGPLLAIIGGLGFKSLNVAGWNSPTDWILPAITLGMVNAAYIARLARGGMLDVLSQDYVRTAHAKGVPLKTIIWKHTLRGGLLPSVSFLGPAFAAMISGSFVIETIFQVPGMGQHFINAANDREYFLIQGLVLFYGFLIVVANLLVDLAQIALNPRLRNA